MAITFVAGVTQSNDAGAATGNLTVNVPSGTQNGDVIIAAVYKAADSVHTLTPPSGWTLINTATDTTNIHATMYYRVANTEPASYIWQVDTTGIWGVGQFTFRGVNNVSPIQASAKATYTTADPATAPSATAITNDVAVLTFRASRDDSTTEVTHTTTDAGTEAADWGNDGGASTRNGAVYYQLARPSGAYAYAVNSSGTVTNGVMYTVILAPAPAGSFTASAPTPTVANIDGAIGTDVSGVLSPDAPLPYVTVRQATEPPDQSAAPGRLIPGAALPSNGEVVGLAGELDAFAPMPVVLFAGVPVGSLTPEAPMPTVDVNGTLLVQGDVERVNAPLPTVDIEAAQNPLRAIAPVPTADINGSVKASGALVATPLSPVVDIAGSAAITSGVSFIASTEATTAGSASLAIDKPAGTVQGDLMLTYVNSFTGAAAPTAPSGWTMIRLVNGGSGVLGLSAWYKIATGSEPASYTWNVGTSSVWNVACSTYRGVDGDNPIHAHNGGTSTNAAQATGNITTTGTTWVSSASGVMESNSTVATCTTSDGLDAERNDFASSTASFMRALAVYDSNRDITAGTQSRTLTTSTGANGQHCCIIVAINPPSDVVALLSPLAPQVAIDVNGTVNISGTIAKNWPSPVVDVAGTLAVSGDLAGTQWPSPVVDLNGQSEVDRINAIAPSVIADLNGSLKASAAIAATAPQPIGMEFVGGYAIGTLAATAPVPTITMGVETKATGARVKKVDPEDRTYYIPASPRVRTIDGLEG